MEAQEGGWGWGAYVDPKPVVGENCSPQRLSARERPPEFVKPL